MSILHPNIATLRAIYEDLSRIEHYGHEDMVLHTAQRHASNQDCIYGKVAVVEKMQALILESGRTLTMNVDSIIANDYFGAALGHIRARRGDDHVGMPFCGLWRFHEGRIVEHWENAYDITALDAFLAGEIGPGTTWVRR